MFRKFTIVAIANEVGFNNAESFSKSFHTKAGIYPSYFNKGNFKIKPPIGGFIQSNFPYYCLFPSINNSFTTTSVM